MIQESIDAQVAEARARKGRKNYYGIRETIKDRLDVKVGFIKAAYLIRSFNTAYDKKHEGNNLPWEENEGLKVFTLGRYLSRYNGLKCTSE